MVQDNKDILVLLAEDLDGNYETLWSTYFNQLYAFALRKTRNKDDAWDIIQEAFERAYRDSRRDLSQAPYPNIDSVKIVSKTSPWEIPKPPPICEPW